MVEVTQGVETAHYFLYKNYTLFSPNTYNFSSGRSISIWQPYSIIEFGVHFTSTKTTSKVVRVHLSNHPKLYTKGRFGYP